MNFVDLVEDLRVECGVSGSPLVTVQNLGGELARLRKWTVDAWNMIQMKHQDWQFMRTTFSFTTTVGKQSYTATDAGVPTMDLWQRDTVWMYLNSRGIVDQMPIEWLEWEHFRRMYVMGHQYCARPTTFTISPTKEMLLGMIPDDVYTVSGECWLAPVTLSLDTDVPSMPAKFHKIIVCEAMKKYAGFEAAAEVMQRATSEGNPLWNALVRDQLQQVTIAGAFDGDYYF
jgi:uncharacterized protein YqcC (DUF446 family)